jgi:hypothetical protein
LDMIQQRHGEQAKPESARRARLDCSCTVGRVGRVGRVGGRVLWANSDSIVEPQMRP